MNILLLLFGCVIILVEFILKMYYYPIIKLYNFLESKNFFTPPNNIIQLVLKLILNLIMTIYSFFIYIFLIIRIYDSYSFFIFIGNSVRFISILLFSSLFLLLINFKNCFIILWNVLYLTYYLINWLLSIIFFLLTGNNHFLKIIMFEIQPENISELTILFLENWSNFFEMIIIMLLTIFHVINIFSIIRIIGLFKTKNVSLRNVLYSSLYIFYDIFFLTPVYILNIFYIWDFIEINKNICFRKKEENKSLYEIISFEITNKKNIILYLFLMILTLISIILFIWRIKKSYKILKDFFKDENIKLFFIRYFLNINTAFIQILLLIEIPMNYLIFFHLKCIRDMNKNKDFKLTFMYKHLTTFIQKNLDFIATIFSSLNLITIPFWNYVIRKRCNIRYLYLLFDNTEIIKNSSNREKRFKLYNISLKQHILNFCIIFSIIFGILNPFITILIISTNYVYFKSAIKNNNYLHLKNNNEEIINTIEFNNDGKNKENINNYNEIISYHIKIFSNLIYVTCFSSFIYLPLSLLLFIIAPWSIKFPYYCLISNIKESLNNFHSFNLEMNKIIIDKESEILQLQILSFLNGYKLIFEFILIHLNLIRIIYFWKDVFISKKSLKELIEQHFILSIEELPFIPFIIIFLIIEPWNYGEIIKFINEEGFYQKFTTFINIFKIFLLDLYVSFMFISLIVTLIDAIPCILLLIRSLKKNIYKREEDILNYQKNYKTDNFRTELKFLFYKHNRNILIFFLFILDILLLVRAVNVIERTLPFIKQYFKKLKIKIKNLFQCFKFNNSNNNIINSKTNLSQMSSYIISEISSFLESYSVVSLSLVNKQLNKRIDTNVTWENIYLNYYRKQLKANLKKDLFELFNPNMFSNYKKCCQKAQELIDENRNIQDKSKLRDKIIGFGRIVEEEAIVSIMLIPNLLFIPWKILTYILFYIGLLIHYFYKWLDNNKYYFIFYFDCINIENMNKDFYFFSIQKNIIMILIFIIYFIIIFIFSSILNIYQWIIKLICFASLSQLDNKQSFIERFNALHYKNLIQVIIGFFIHLIHIIIEHIPNIYYIYYYFDGLKPIKSFNDIIYIINAFYNFRLIGKLQIIFGIYGLRIVVLVIQFHFIKILEEEIFSYSEIYFYKIIYEIHIIYGNSFLYLFPMNSVCLYINYALKILLEKKLLVCGKIFSNVLLSIIGFILAIIPFIFSFLCFDIKEIGKIIILFVPLFTYSMINLFFIGKAIDKNHTLNEINN